MTVQEQVDGTRRALAEAKHHRDQMLALGLAAIESRESESLVVLKAAAYEYALLHRLDNAPELLQDLIGLRTAANIARIQVFKLAGEVKL